MSQTEFNDTISKIAAEISGMPVDGQLEIYLNDTYPAGGAAFDRIEALCAEGVQDGWLCNREAGGIKFGRALKPGGETHGFSVDVVQMEDVKGPHHVHTTGEIGMIMPRRGSAKFDGMGRGWYVYPPGSAHHPTVSDGEALVLYLLPDGQIEFTGK